MQPEQVDNLIQLRFHKESLEHQLKEVNKEITELTLELSSYMDLHGVGSLVGEDGTKVSKRQLVYPKVTDARSLLDWWYGGGKEEIMSKWPEWSNHFKTSEIEPEIQVEKLNTKMLNLIVRALAMEAENTGVPITDIMPPGLEYSAKTSLSVRKPSKRAQWENKAKSLLEELKEREGQC